MALYVCTSTWSGQPDRPQLNAVRAQFRICHDRDPPFDRSHPVTVQKRLEFKLSTPRQLAMQMRSRLLVEVPTRLPSASVTEAVFSISFSLQLDTQKRPLL